MGSRLPRAPPPRRSTGATGSGGISTSGPRPTRSRRWWAPSRSRSSTASAAGDCPPRWNEVKAEVAGGLIAHGPSASGVYARFAGSDGRELQLLNTGGQVARTLGADSGLIAATADSSSEPTWLITGTDPAGVAAAAAALTPSALHDHFALAVQGATRLPVPLTPRAPRSTVGAPARCTRPG